MSGILEVIYIDVKDEGYEEDIFLFYVDRFRFNVIVIFKRWLE